MTPLGMRPTLALQERGVKQRCRKDTVGRPGRGKPRPYIPYLEAIKA
jgi:hypothetical protein